ncbi:Biotin-requiring enzyme [Actinoplanes regularis]|uniref:Biotin-requiring enzyme n=2 Tax=Actinoplanes regularis TaxID=52697 RepID=A0A239D0I3_9ACTN|nr:Biotin-requiring enzyme [Actinoplanes regularis]
MPALGEDVIEATVSRWLKQVGDRIAAGEPLVEISTGKVAFEVPADTSGHLREIRIPAGTTVPAGSVIALIEPSVAVPS